MSRMIEIAPSAMFIIRWRNSALPWAVFTFKRASANHPLGLPFQSLELVARNIAPIGRRSFHFNFAGKTCANFLYTSPTNCSSADFARPKRNVIVYWSVPFGGMGRSIVGKLSGKDATRSVFRFRGKIVFVGRLSAQGNP